MLLGVSKISHFQSGFEVHPKFALLVTSLPVFMNVYPCLLFSGACANPEILEMTTTRTAPRSLNGSRPPFSVPRCVCEERDVKVER